MGLIWPSRIHLYVDIECGCGNYNDTNVYGYHPNRVVLCRVRSCDRWVAIVNIIARFNTPKHNQP